MADTEPATAAAHERATPPERRTRTATSAREPEGHDWRKSEPATEGATPVWACKRCGLYRTDEPNPPAYDLSRCLCDFA